MAPKQSAQTIVVATSIDELRASIVSGLRRANVNVVFVERTYIEFRRGSQAAYRLKGAMLCRPDEMPIVGGCQLSETEDGRTRADVTVRDEHSFGARMGTNKKFDAAIAATMQIVVTTASNTATRPQAGTEE